MLDFLSPLQNIVWSFNTAYDYLVATAVFLGILAVLKIFQVLILAHLKKLAKKTQTDFDDVLIDILKKIKFYFYILLSFFVAVQFVILPDIVEEIVKILFLLSLVYEIIQAIDKLVKYGLNYYFKKRSTENEIKQTESMVRVIQILIKVGLWIIGLLAVLSNLGINVTSLIASLGIGGLAVALALQNILSDLFSSFSIYVDKPYEIGDFIIIGEHMGTVEKIGLKTTRIRSLGGEQLVVSNKELTSTRVQNFGRMNRRRVVFKLGLVYDTPLEKLKLANAIIKDIVEKTEKVSFDRSHFYEYGDFSLNFEVVMYVESADYNEYMDLREKINLEIFDKFSQQGLEFAYPTQTLHLKK